MATWQQDPEAGKPNDAPSWMDQGDANSRLGLDPTALASVWLEATDDDAFGGQGGKQQAVAGAAAQQVVQGGKHPGAPEKCCPKSCDLCLGTTIFGLEFVFVVVFEFLHSYCGWSAWFCKDQLDKLTKTDPNQPEAKSQGNVACKYFCIICLAVAFMLFIVASFAMLICQLGAVELCAVFAFAFRGLAAFSADHAMWAWARTREVGHKTRTALGRKCRKQPRGAGGGSAEPPPANSVLGATPPAAAPPPQGQGLAPPGGPKGQASFVGGATAPTPAPSAGAASAEAPPSWATDVPVAQPVLSAMPPPPPPSAAPAGSDDAPSWVNG